MKKWDKDALVTREGQIKAYPQQEQKGEGGRSWTSVQRRKHSKYKVRDILGTLLFIMWTARKVHGHVRSGLSGYIERWTWEQGMRENIRPWEGTV